MCGTGRERLCIICLPCAILTFENSQSTSISSSPAFHLGYRFIDSTPSRETSVVRPVCAPVSLDYDEIWMRSPSDKAMAAMVASEVAERLLMRTTVSTASSHEERKGEHNLNWQRLAIR